MAVGTTNFPTSLDTVLELVEVTNDASTQLNGALTINATTITVDSTSLFPSSGIITIDSENISYTGKTATTFTGCTRAAESTTAATHDDNATVELLITAALPTVHAAAIIAIQTKLGSGAAIDAAKIADGSISNAEFQYLNGVSSAIQTQLDAKQATFGSQTANYVYAGPTSGGAASPSFRALVSGDLPSHNQAWSTITSTPTTLSGYGIADAAANGAVTASGLTMATARLLGRSTADTGAIEEISIGIGLTLSTGTLSASGAIVDTKANLLGTLRSAGVIAYASDTKQFGVYTGSGLDFDQIPQVAEVAAPDIGSIQNSPRNGISASFITDKAIINSTIGYSGVASAGGLRITSTGKFQIYLNSTWNDIVFNFVLREVSANNYALEHAPIGFANYLEMMTGMSLSALGVNGLPLTNAYKTTIGAYGYPGKIGGRAI